MTRARTVVQTEGIRVYRRATTFFACRFASGRSVRLGRTTSRVRVQHIRVRGSYVAYAINVDPLAPADNNGPAESGARRVDMRTGRVQREKACSSSIEALVLSRRGSIAWVCTSAPRTAHRRVYKHDSRGVAELDEGASDTSGVIEDLGLAESEDRVYWTKAGVAYSAPLS